MTTENRPWGSFTILDETQHYKVKRLEVHPGHRLSYQSHEKRDEHWVVVEGIATVTLDDQVQQVLAGKNVFIPRRSKHRLANTATTELKLIEVQTGDYFGEDDIKRFEDDYKRS